jgi:hypothetical protein
MNEQNIPSDLGQNAGLEQRLSKLKPRRPFIDIDSIATMADSSDSATQVVVAEAPPDKGWYSPSVLAGTVAASWICGVAVGALVVFFSLSNSSSLDRNVDVVGVGIKEVQDATVSMSTAPTRSEVAMAEAGVQSRSEDSRWDLDLGTMPLQVGMSLRSRNRLVRTGSLSSTRAFVRNPEIRSDNQDILQNDRAPNLDAVILNSLPSTAATQSELLKALLDTNRNIH